MRMLGAGDPNLLPRQDGRGEGRCALTRRRRQEGLGKRWKQVGAGLRRGGGGVQYGRWCERVETGLWAETGAD